MSFLARHKLLVATGSTLAAGVVGLHFYRAVGERRYPALALEELPLSSGIRTLFEKHGTPTTATRTCTAMQPVVVPPFRGDGERWLPNFVALSYTMPRATLERYAVQRLGLKQPGHDARLDLQTLLYAAATAYWDAIPHRPEVRLGLRETELTPGRQWADAREVFAQPGTYAWKFNTFGTWHYVPGPSQLPVALDPSALRLDGRVFEPPSAMPANADRVGAPNESAGALLYWRFDKLTDPAAVDFVDKAASFGYPFRFMVGGIHELIVEDHGEGLLRISYVLTEAYDLHPLAKTEMDKKIIPKWTLSLHRDYARSMLNGAVRQIERSV